jgi:hypothetical protein
MSSDYAPTPSYPGEPTQVATADQRAYEWHLQPAPAAHRVLQQLLAPEQTNRWWNGASVFLAMPGDMTIASAVHTAVTTADEWQLRLDQGPAISTICARRDVLVDDTSIDPRWPLWAAEMAKMGWRSVLTKSVGTSASGAALCIYAHPPGAFSDDALLAAEALARRARSAVAAALDVLWSDDTGQDADSVVSHAILRVMDQYCLDQYDGFDLLHGLAQGQQASLSSVAAQIMSGRHGLA